VKFGKDGNKKIENLELVLMKQFQQIWLFIYQLCL